ncbi:N-acetyltransferase [Pseudoclavibacter sp. Z016]|uniref:GNAT family N-acetyltransferase n=1 Tax=Pseudoclavibacter sp. Z016 TaxID=2080581 RepID=UPI0021584533|nr:GNAT family N-acetyltransferase [Pseudoclavibacter sp. Z016]
MPDDREDLISLALRAWEPVFPLTEQAVSPFVYRAFYPDGWRARQRADISAVLDEEPENIDVAFSGSQVAGWVCTRLHPEDRMGEVYVLAVDPDLQRRGIGRALLEHSTRRAKSAGTSMVMVETGDDPGHEPARRAYEADGFERWPVARYFKDLSGH